MHGTRTYNDVGHADVLCSYVGTQRWYFPKYTCSAQLGFFLYFFDVVLSRNVAQVFYEWFWGDWPRNYWYNFSLIVVTVFIVWGTYILEPSRLLSWSYVYLLQLQHLLTCSFCIILYYDVRFMVMDDCVGLQLLIWFTIMTWFCQFWCMFTLVYYYYYS
jgi:hypothetical protein